MHAPSLLADLLPQHRVVLGKVGVEQLDLPPERRDVVRYV